MSGSCRAVSHRDRFLYYGTPHTTRCSVFSLVCSLLSRQYPNHRGEGDWEEANHAANVTIDIVIDSVGHLGSGAPKDGSYFCL